MKDNKTEQNQRSWRMTALTTAVLMALSITSISVSNAANNKKIGDLEIYKAAEGGNVTIMMMLDTSGSMTLRQVDFACDLPAGTPVVKKTEKSLTTPSYERDYCEVNGEKKYDRLTRLKDAIFALMDNAQLDSNKVLIGIGQYSSQSGSDNKVVFTPSGYAAGDSSSGKILVPAALLNDAQRTKIKTVVAEAGGGLGTPTANAYAEVGAYMLGTNTITSPESIYSGFNKSVTASKNNNSYISPLNTSSTTASCNGQGIYFLTDGVPNGAPNPLPLMQMALGNKGNSFNVPAIGTLPQGSVVGANGMPAVGEFAKALRNATSNPLGKNGTIKTAVVGFGSDFDVDKEADALKPEADRVIRTLSYTNARGEEETGEFYNCSKITNIDTRNACNWGAKSNSELTGVGGFGEGGFYSAQSTDDIVNSIVNFVNDLNQTIPTAPSGTITVPNDPYQASSQLAYAYLPMLDPDIASTASIWKGNLKKYALNKGTLFGKNDNKLYNNVAGDLSNITQDLWQSGDYKVKEATVNNDIEAGGFYAQLKAPNTANIDSVRTVYVEDFKDTNDKTPVLRKLEVIGGKPIGFDALKDTTTYTPLNQRRLLSFLGFDNTIKLGIVQSLLNIDGTLPTDAVNITNAMTLAAPAQEVRVLGGVIHSKPTAISYSATLDENGRVTDDLSKRDDYVLFGSMDGALHLADSDDGKEAVAIIPRAMMINQAEALVPNSTKASVGQPYFGVDAPWLVTTDYKYDLPAQATETTAAKSGKVTVDDSTGKGMFAYGGLRMGGEAFYGMDITKSTTPKVLFTITPEGLNGQASTDFERLGQIWSKPTAARIRQTKDAEPIDVLIFGGGYDMQYESDDYVASATTPAKGNAIYIINADTGALVTSLTTSNNSAMIHSITGEITILDRDNDGLMDHLYAADLGGQVFRADFENARPKKFGFEAVNTATVKRVTRILDTAPTALANKKFAYRFYERPVVSFYRSEGGTNNGNIFALVNVISGNRSSPLSTLRSSNDFANRVYGIIDTDVGRSDLFTAADTSLGMANTNESSLVNLASTLGNTPTEDKKKDTQDLLMGTASVAAKNGWYYPLTRFDGYNNVRYNKGVGDSVVIDNLLYTTVYNPDKQYGTVDSCSAKITGGSERQVYCLPYGICMDSASTTGTGGFTPAGQGIQELTLGAFNDKNTNLKVLIGTTTIADRILADNRNNYNAGSGSGFGDTQYSGSNGGNSTPKPVVAGGDGSAVEYIFNERYTLQPRAWYERQQ